MVPAVRRRSGTTSGSSCHIRREGPPLRQSLACNNMHAPQRGGLGLAWAPSDSLFLCDDAQRPGYMKHNNNAAVRYALSAEYYCPCSPILPVQSRDIAALNIGRLDACMCAWFCGWGELNGQSRGPAWAHGHMPFPSSAHAHAMTSACFCCHAHAGL